MSDPIAPLPRPRPYHVGHVRETLLDRAGETLRDEGLAQLNLRSLSRKTGVALGSVYHHFESKGDLLAALAVRGFQQLKAELSEVLSQDGGAKLRACIGRYFVFARREPGLYALMFDAQVSRFEAVQAERAAVFQLFEDVITLTPVPPERLQIERLGRRTSGRIVLV
ncbi:MAG: TetR/AcrR family transcriptional regulator, partial [Caulobacteraceae bacterium]